VLTKSEEGLPSFGEVAVGNRVTAILETEDDWITLTFENGWQVCIYTEVPLVFVHPEQQ
jgi:hypothetical protein